ncbi:MAG: hypothetical protein LBL39_04815 [Planctomycetaceae bacterium]|nr:hypothetical protein [Planctomycetaceae bacterium]
MSQNAPLCPYFWRLNEKKGIRARLVVLLATKGLLINKGCMLKLFRKAMLSSAKLLRLGN